jgi:hypothetical protein
MSIIVACPGCLKSFTVSDKFAGRTGPCPNCKRPLKVPDKSQEVKIEAPEEFASGGKSVSGKLIVKPVAFTPTRLQPVRTTLIVAAALGVVAIAWLGGRAGTFQNPWLTVLGLLCVSPPLVVVAYAVLRNDELEPYRGVPLMFRASLCALGYVFLWGAFALLTSREVITGEMWNWVFVVPPFAVMGGVFALATLDLGFGDGMLHFGFYLLATVVLRWVAGMKWVWDVAS